MKVRGGGVPVNLYGRQVRSMVDNEPGFPELQAELQQRRSAQTRSRETIESRS